MGLFSYETAKYVHINDSRLGILRWCLIVGIIVYVIVFEMLAMGGWLESTSVTGVVRFSLQQPTVKNCNPMEDDCYNAFVEPHNLPYCQQYYDNNNSGDSSREYVGKVYPCEIYEAMNAQIVSESSITVITRASTTEQELVCDGGNASGGIGGSDGIGGIGGISGSIMNTWEIDNNNNNIDNKRNYLDRNGRTQLSDETKDIAAFSSCSSRRTYNNTSKEYKFYTAQSEAFTILLDHAVTSSKICSTRMATSGNNNHYSCSSQASAYQGRLYSTNDELCRQQFATKNHTAYRSHDGNKPTHSAPCYIQPNQTTSGQDFFTLDVLLRASNITLDDINTDNPATSSNTTTTYRDTGGTILLNIYWSDFRPYDGNHRTPFYYYSAQFITGSQYKQEIPFYTNYRQTRTVLNAHGIKVAVLLSGEFHQFNIVTFGITLTTAIGLLAVATTIVDMFMLYILPEKKQYQTVKYENIPTPRQQNNNRNAIIEMSNSFHGGLTRTDEGEAVTEENHEQQESEEQQNITATDTSAVLNTTSTSCEDATEMLHEPLLATAHPS